MSKSFGDILKSIRIEKDMSQEDFAKLLGTTKQVISRYENGLRTPKITVAKQYAEKLGVTLPYLLGDDENAESEEKPTLKNEDGLDEQERQIMGMVKQLTAEKKSFLADWLRSTLGQEQ